MIIKTARAERYISYILFAIFVIFMGLIVISASYTYLCEDDYSWICGVKDTAKLWGGNSFTNSLRSAWGFYKAHQGTYVFNFLVYFINPYGRGGMIGLHAFMIANVLLYFYAVHCFFSSVIDNVNAKWMICVLFVMSTFCTYYSEGNKELFLWYTGTLNYTLQISLSLITTAIVIKVIRKRKSNKFLILASITGFIASGGTLEITAANCAWLLIVLIICFKRVIENKKLVIPFVISLFGAIINVIAPGNFIRSDASVNEGHMGLMDAVIDDLVCVIGETKKMFTSPLFILILLICFLLAIFMKRMIEYDESVSLQWAILSWLSTIVVQIMVVFPVTLGNRVNNLNAYRTDQTYHILMSVMYMFATIMTGLHFRKYNNKIKGIAIGVVCSLLLCVSVFSDESKSDIQNGFMSKLIYDIKTENLKNNYMVRSYILATLEMAEQGSDVILFMPYYECKSTYGMGIGEDPNSFVNDTVENWREVNSVTVYYWGLTYPPKEE